MTSAGRGDATTKSPICSADAVRIKQRDGGGSDNFTIRQSNGGSRGSSCCNETLKRLRETMERSNVTLFLWVRALEACLCFASLGECPRSSRRVSLDLLSYRGNGDRQTTPRVLIAYSWHCD